MIIILHTPSICVWLDAVSLVSLVASLPTIWSLIVGEHITATANKAAIDVTELRMVLKR